MLKSWFSHEEVDARRARRCGHGEAMIRLVFLVDLGQARGMKDMGVYLYMSRYSTDSGLARYKGFSSRKDRK